MKKYKILLAFVACLTSIKGEVVISGKVHIDETWTPVVFASYLTGYEDMYKCANYMVIRSATIDSLGHWKMSLPDQEHSYIIRLHIAKKSNPPLSLIIGGEDENFGYFAIDNIDSLKILSLSDKLFTSFNTNNDEINFNLKKVDEMVKAWRLRDQEIEDISLQAQLRLNHIENLVSYAININEPLTSAYTLLKADFGYNREKIIAHMENLAINFSDHPYFMPFRKSNSIGFFRDSAYLLLTVLLLFTPIWIKKLKVLKLEKRIQTLSPREYEVFKLVIAGMSNKEVASLLNVETSTIKSHLHKIFSKLRIKSRQELRKFKGLGALKQN